MQQIALFLPLTHAVAMARPLMNDAVPPDLLTHVLALLAYATTGFYVALVLTRKRLLQ